MKAWVVWSLIALFLSLLWIVISKLTEGNYDTEHEQWKNWIEEREEELRNQEDPSSRRKE